MDSLIGSNFELFDIESRQNENVTRPLQIKDLGESWENSVGTYMATYWLLH